MPFVGNLSKPRDYNRLPYKVNCGLSRCLRSIHLCIFENDIYLFVMPYKCISFVCSCILIKLYYIKHGNTFIKNEV